MARADPRRFAEESVEAVRTLLESEKTTARLTAKELGKYPARRPMFGWRVILPVDGQPMHVDVLLRGDFPWSPPLIALPGGPPFPIWPHVEPDGVLCILGSEASVDVNDPAGVTRYLLMEALGLVKKLSRGELVDDFRSEFESYWSWGIKSDGSEAISLCDPGGTSREIRCWIGTDKVVLAEDDETIFRWLTNRGRDKKQGVPVTRAAVLACISEPPLPSEYPTDGLSMLRFLDVVASNAADLFRSLTLTSDGDVLVALSANTGRGTSIAAIMVPRPRPIHTPGYRGPDPIQKGFRPGRVPAQTVIQRFMSGNTALRLRTDRADAGWIHGRDQDHRFRSLRNAHVAFIGCGSLGAPVARLLAQSGLGRLTLVDPDRLSWANIGRHTLGSEYVGRNKAESLSTALRKDFPHILGVDPMKRRLEEVLLENAAAFEPADVIVSTTGNWASIAALCDWGRSASSKPVVVGWTEPHACAGHAVAIVGDDACIHCGFDKTGLPSFRATEWDGGSQLKQEPACGASFQPYGPIEMSHIATMTADMVLDVLLGEVVVPTHRVWGARTRFVEQSGGRWTREWLAMAPHAGQGGLMLERPWMHSSNCGKCHESLAA